MLRSVARLGNGAVTAMKERACLQRADALPVSTLNSFKPYWQSCFLPLLCLSFHSTTSTRTTTSSSRPLEAVKRARAMLKLEKGEKSLSERSIEERSWIFVARPLALSCHDLLQLQSQFCRTKLQVHQLVRQPCTIARKNKSKVISNWSEPTKNLVCGRIGTQTRPGRIGP